MKNLLLNDKTKDAISRFLNRPTHGLALVGPIGAGKHTLALTMAVKLLRISAEKLASYPYFMEVQIEEKDSISIDAVRNIIHFTTLKTTNKPGIARVIVIVDADLLTDQAQNALLKTLEEPPDDTVIIMTLNTIESVLPTVRSRVQQIILGPLDRTTVTQYFIQHGNTESAVQRAYLMSGGLPGLMSAILDSNIEHPLWQATEIARNILKGSTFERLSITDSIYKQKQLTHDILFMIGQMADVALIGSRDVDLAYRIKWAKVLSATQEAQSALDVNTQTRLVLLNFVLAL